VWARSRSVRRRRRSDAATLRGRPAGASEGRYGVRRRGRRRGQFGCKSAPWTTSAAWACVRDADLFRDHAGTGLL
jgi:hypothetical protein